MSKKITGLILILIFAGMLLPSVSQAVANIYTTCTAINEDGNCVEPTIPICYEGFVPCGALKPYWEGNVSIADGRCNGDTMAEQGTPCTFCHFFVMLNGIIKYILVSIIPYLAVLMLIIGGVMYYFGGGKPDLLIKGKKILIGVVIGLFLVYGSYMLVGLFLNILGATEWTVLESWASQGPFSINCPIAIP